MRIGLYGFSGCWLVSLIARGAHSRNSRVVMTLRSISLVLMLDLARLQQRAVVEVQFYMQIAI